MLRRHLTAIAAVTKTPALEYRVRRYFALGSGHLIHEMSRARLSQADVVLCLVRMGTPRARRIAESLIGRPITVAPACRLTWSQNTQRPNVGRQPVITHVEDNILLRRGTRLHRLLPELKCGRTLQQLQVRGVTRGDVRRAMRQGIIRVSGLN